MFVYLLMIFRHFQAKGASIGDVFLVSHVTFHDRRIPIPVTSHSILGFPITYLAPVKEVFMFIFYAAARIFILLYFS